MDAAKLAEAAKRARRASTVSSGATLVTCGRDTAFNAFPQCLVRLEVWPPFRRDRRCCSRPGIAPRSGAPATDTEAAESPNPRIPESRPCRRRPAPSAGHRAEDRRLEGLLPGQLGEALGKAIVQFRFEHDRILPKRCAVPRIDRFAHRFASTTAESRAWAGIRRSWCDRGHGPRVAVRPLSPARRLCHLYRVARCCRTFGLKQSATPHSIMMMDAIGFDAYDSLQRSARWR